jgi:hypothetical protein
MAFDSQLYFVLSLEWQLPSRGMRSASIPVMSVTLFLCQSQNFMIILHASLNGEVKKTYNCR